MLRRSQHSRKRISGRAQRGFAGQTLHVYNWTTYIAEDTISNFERLCGVTVHYNTYASDTDMIDELEQGNPGYDIVVPTDANVSPMIAEGLLEPLNLAHISEFRQYRPTHSKIRRTTRNNVHTVPYQWGTIGVGYNRTKVGKDITSWNDVFNYNGPVAWIDYPRQMLGIVLNLLGDDPNTSDRGADRGRQPVSDRPQRQSSTPLRRTPVRTCSPLSQADIVDRIQRRHLPDDLGLPMQRFRLHHSQTKAR